VKVSDLVGRRRIDLNVDIAEGFQFDRELLRFATSANIACGVHAGSEVLTMETVEYCKKRGIRFGVHPGYPDREHMGRRSMEPHEHREYLDSLFEQTRRFVQFARPAYLKPHGAFYNDTALVLPEDWDLPPEDSEENAYDIGGRFLATKPGVQSLTMLLRVHRLPLMGLPGTAHETIARRAKQNMIREGFADRAYDASGALVPRSQPDAVLHDPDQIRRQVLALATTVDSICLHGDTPNCVAFAELVVKTLVDAGLEVGH
jgi:5-oxoprolinase (ATP-hydrolysing) subunit A